ncbi:MAG: ParB N-terminal domain-containing protein [Oscillospiraceae bacterium]|nr:ParB N-terminal domain-containing protein [Oscillospiraceae bacterium]
MKKQFNFENLKMSDYSYAEDLYVDEETCHRLNKLMDDLGYSDKIRFHVTELENEITSFDLFSDPNEDDKPFLKINKSYNEIRNNPILDDLKFSKKIEYINISKMYAMEDSINFFDYPNDEELLELIKSLEFFGVLQPLIVMKDESNVNYEIIDGRSRFLASKALYKKTGNEIYANLPCITIEASANYSVIQGIIIANNMRYRTVSREALMKSIFLLDEIYKISNEFKNVSAAAKIARAAGVSRTTVNNYLELKKLSPLAMDLVVKKYMNLSVAKVLSSKDAETQDKIIIGLKNNINDIEKVYEMMKGPYEAIYNKETKSMIPDTWEMKTARVNEMIPQYTYIKLKVAFNDVEEVFTGINDLRRAYALKYLPLRNNGLNKYFKVSYDEHDVQQYIKSGHLSQKTYDKLSTGVFNEIIKRA